MKVESAVSSDIAAKALREAPRRASISGRLTQVRAVA